jgi:BirA family biotin operon repressor/biotin-[acetyl-CoA-carboxylase] ligase
VSSFLSRREAFGRVASTNDVVRAWLSAGTPEVCLATTDEQTAGRGRAGRTWSAPSGAALLLSLGFRPGWLAADRVWRLAAVASLAMADAAESVVGLPGGTIRLKWPNDLVIETDAAGPRKVAGVLGETEGLGTPDPQAVIGLGINVDWPAVAFPPELAGVMTSLRDAAGDRPVDREALLTSFVARLEEAIAALRDGRFAAAAWEARQLTTGRWIRLEQPDRSELVRALGVDPASGALLVESPAAPGTPTHRPVFAGEVSHVRLADPIPARV